MKTFDNCFNSDLKPHFLVFLLLLVGLAGWSQPCIDNILYNGDASDGFNGWTIISQSGNGWRANATGQRFDTSFGSCPESSSKCRKYQLVDLVAAGFTPDYLDSSPQITVGETAISFFLNALCYDGISALDPYYVRYEIRDANQNVLASYNSGTPTNSLRASQFGSQEKASFTNYGSGARYVYFEDGGTDSGFWAGWYGTSFRDAFVNVAFDCAVDLTCPDDVTVSSLSDVVSAPVAIASDANSCCSAPSLSYTDTYIDADICSPTIVREWGASTSSGTNICRQNIKVIFDCGIVCPINTCVDMDSDLNPNVLGQARAQYGCELNFLSYTDLEQSECEGVQQVLRTWKANFVGSPDCYRSCSQIITFNDDTAPVITSCPEDIIVSSSCQNVHWEEPKAGDNCLRVTLWSDHAPGSSFDQGSTLVTYTAMDNCGNASLCSFNVIVEQEMSSDCPGDLVMDYNEAGVTWPEPQYSETCDECPQASYISGYTRIGSFGGSDYYVTTRTYDYATSRAKAEAAGGYLASISNREENRFLSRAHAGRAFIGLSDSTSEGDFQWHSGQDMDYSNWFYNQPNNHLGNQHYVEILSSGEWNDAEDKDSYSIMEKPCSNVRQVSGPTLGTQLMPGSYDIAYTIEDGCGYASCCSFTLTITDPVQGSLTSTSQTQESMLGQEAESELPSVIIETPLFEERVVEVIELKVYPNPVSDILNVKGLEDASYAIYDQNGNLILDESNTDYLDVAQFIPGVYMLRTTDGRITRFVKM